MEAHPRAPHSVTLPSWPHAVTPGTAVGSLLRSSVLVRPHTHTHTCTHSLPLPVCLSLTHTHTHTWNKEFKIGPNSEFQGEQRREVLVGRTGMF